LGTIKNPNVCIVLTKKTRKRNVVITRLGISNDLRTS